MARVLEKDSSACTSVIQLRSISVANDGFGIAVWDFSVLPFGSTINLDFEPVVGGVMAFVLSSQTQPSSVFAHTPPVRF